MAALHLVGALSTPCWPYGMGKQRGLVQPVLRRLWEAWSFLQRRTLQQQRRVLLPTEHDTAEAACAVAASRGEQEAGRAPPLLPSWRRRPR